MNDDDSTEGQDTPEPGAPEADNPDTAILARLEGLKADHQALDAEVARLSAAALPDQVQIARLKKRKLLLKDMIVRLEDQLTPDIIA